MVSFTSLFVLATAGFSAVSAVPILKRDLSSDVATIGSALNDFDSALQTINVQDPTGTKATITQDLNALISALASAAIAEEGQPEVSVAETPQLMTLLTDLNTLVSGIEAVLPTIQSVPGLDDIMRSGLDATESAAAAYINSVIGILPPDLKTGAAASMVQILASFQTVEGLLSTPPS